MVAPWPVIVQPFRRTIGRAGNGARSVGEADDLGREMVDRHNGRYTALLSAGRQRCISAHYHSLPFARTEERRVGKECVSKCGWRGSPSHYTKHINNIRKCVAA